MKDGYVSLVGAGCGDLELLTLKAQKRLLGCDVLVYDSLAASGIVDQAPPDCEKIFVGKRYGSHATAQEQINALLVQKAQEGKHVVRLKGGDPYVFGRGGEEALALQAAGIFCEEIPGITSAIAVPAAAGIPVTHRGLARSVTVVTGTTVQEDGQEGLSMDFNALAGLEGTLVILMGMHHLARIARGLIDAGKAPDTPCAVIMDGTTAEQKSVRAPLSLIAEKAKEAGLSSPAVIVVGAVAGLQLCCGTGMEGTGRSLSGIRVGVTGTLRFSGKLSALLQEKGACVQDLSFLEIRKSTDPLPELPPYGWLVFTSPNGVRIFFEKMKEERRDFRCLCGHPIAVIGPGTAGALKEAGIYADFMPEVFDVQHLAKGLAGLLSDEKQAAHAGKAGEKPTLFLRARQGSAVLPEVFAAQGLAFLEFPLYETRVEEEKRRHAGKVCADYLVFGSGSGVRTFFEGTGPGEDAFGGQYVCMGEACGRELSRFTDRPFLTALQSSVEGIVACICQDAKLRRREKEKSCGGSDTCEPF